MYSNFIKASLALSLAATVIFSQTSPIMAQGKKDWAHSQAPGRVNKLEVHDFVLNLDLPNVALEYMFGGNYSDASPSSAKQKVAIDSKGVEVSQKIHPDSGSVNQRVAINNKIVVNQSVNRISNSNQNNHTTDMHCTNQSSAVKVERSGVVSVEGVEVMVSISGSTVRFTDANNDPISVEFCVKAAAKNSDTLVGSTGKVSFTNNGGQIPDISYVAIYGLHEDAINTNNDDSDTPVIGQEDEAPEDQGETLSTNTKKTAVMGTSIERDSLGSDLPFTGGAGMVAAQAIGLFLIVIGLVIVHVRKIQSQIAEQLSA